jgi:SAM-dependent methyltransferase
MENAGHSSTQKPATAARMYDYYLGGVHNFPADQEAARKVIAQFPKITVAARANRAFLRRAVRYLVEAGVRQFLDIGSGIPTEGNVHEIAQAAAPEAHVVYVDIDSVAVAESLELLDGNQRATAIRANLRSPQDVIDHPSVRRLLDFSQPVGLLLAAVLHFVPDDEEAYGVVAQLARSLVPGSYLAVSHVAAESFVPTSDEMRVAVDVYQRQTTTSATSRSHDAIARFFTGFDLVDPGISWVHEWRPEPDEPVECDPGPFRSGEWAGVGLKK